MINVLLTLINEESNMADERIMPGHIQGKKVERINHRGDREPNFLDKPTKTLSPVANVYRSISILIKNWKVMPITIPQTKPSPYLADKYGQSINSPLPRPKPRRTKLGPSNLENFGG